MTRVLLVCMGNICRSPVAEGIVRHYAAQRGKTVFTDSAGTYGGHEGEPPDSRAIQTAKSRGIDISDLRARPLRAEDFADFDIILVADEANYRAALARKPANARAHLGYMLDWHPDVATGKLPREVPDPYYGGRKDFEHVHNLLDTALAAWVDTL